MVQLWYILGKTVERFFKNFLIELLYNPTISFLGIYPNEIKTEYQNNICPSRFLEALLTIAKICKRP